MSAFAENLRRLMDTHGMGPTELARVAHADRASVYDWLGGGGISENRLELLAAHFGVTPALLRYGATGVDAAVLSEVIAAVELGLERVDQVLAPDRKAELIVAFYSEAITDARPVSEMRIPALIGVFSQQKDDSEAS